LLDEQRKEEISRSYLNAVCAYKGIAVEHDIHDDDSVDATLKTEIVRKNGDSFDATINVQLKATSQKLFEDEFGFSFELPLKNFHDLRKPSTVQKILCVLRLPNSEGDWLTHSVNELILRNCMFWCDLTKMPETNNTTSVTIHVPWENTLTPEKALELMKIVAENGFL
jgi:hypothetical protein